MLHQINLAVAQRNVALLVHFAVISQFNLISVSPAVRWMVASGSSRPYRLRSSASSITKADLKSANGFKRSFIFSGSVGKSESPS
ncbi:hypothetical protein EVA_04650 [gut metagenome]|uniref:Uncharacterized protein n=1 Tax=gut metagenome TaxID=749906 RepID=J9GI59_9ZZZZ